MLSLCQWDFAFLTSILRSQPESDDLLPNKSVKKCNKNQPQGKIVDLLRKQAQQLPSNTGSGLRPTDVPSMSRDAKKLDSQFKCSGTATSVKGRPLGSLEKAVEGTRDRRRSPAAGHISSINAATSAVTSGSGTDPKCESVAQCFATSCFDPLSRSERAQTLSTQASVSRSSRDPGLSSAVHRKAGVLSRRRASPVSTSTHKKQHRLNSMDLPAGLLSTQLSHEIPDQASMTLTSPPDTMPMYACERPAIEAARTHHVVEKPCLSPRENSRGAHMYSTLIFSARLILCPQLLYRVQYPQRFQHYPYWLLALHLTYPTGMRPMNFLNRSRFTAKILIRISPHPSLSTLHVLCLHLHGNLLMTTPPCNPLAMTTANGQHFLNASHGPAGRQVIWLPPRPISACQSACAICQQQRRIMRRGPGSVPESHCTALHPVPSPWTSKASKADTRSYVAPCARYVPSSPLIWAVHYYFSVHGDWS